MSRFEMKDENPTILDSDNLVLCHFPTHNMVADLLTKPHQTSVSTTSTQARAWDSHNFLLGGVLDYWFQYTSVYMFQVWSKPSCDRLDEGRRCGHLHKTQDGIWWMELWRSGLKMWACVDQEDIGVSEVVSGKDSTLYKWMLICLIISSLFSPEFFFLHWKWKNSSE